jgi:hypothetical protein
LERNAFFFVVGFARLGQTVVIHRSFGCSMQAANTPERGSGRCSCCCRGGGGGVNCPKMRAANIEQNEEKHLIITVFLFKKNDGALNCW